MTIDFNERAKIVHKNNEKWWVDLETLERIDRNKGEMLMLVITELAEAAEGIRKNLNDDHLPHRKMAEVELADAEIRLLDFAGGFGYTIEDSFINQLYETDISKKEGLKNTLNLNNQLESLLEVCEPVITLHQEIRKKAGIEEISEALSFCLFAIRSFAWFFEYDIEGSYHEKLEYNKTRKDHSIEERKKPNGKKV